MLGSVPKRKEVLVQWLICLRVRNSFIADYISDLMTVNVLEKE